VRIGTNLVACVRDDWLLVLSSTVSCVASISIVGFASNISDIFPTIHQYLAIGFQLPIQTAVDLCGQTRPGIRTYPPTRNMHLILNSSLMSV